MYQFRPLPLEGAFEITAPRFLDQRGSFLKIFSDELFAKEIGQSLVFKEFFTSVSGENVLRGMHCQLPPHDHAKLVTCLSGKVLDVIVDVRKNSATFGQCAAIELSESAHNLVLAPSGFAHGFYVLEAPAVMFYAVETVHAPQHDSGIHWNSFGFDWPSKNPIVSERDSQLSHLKNFHSPF